MGIKYDYNVVVAVDLDGTLTKTDNFPDLSYEFNFHAIKWIKKIKSLGIILILWTCGNEQILNKKIKELNDFGIQFDYINNYSNIRGQTRKINADFYIDDRANDGKIRWRLIYKKIKKLKKIYQKLQLKEQISVKNKEKKNYEKN